MIEIIKGSFMYAALFFAIIVILSIVLRVIKRKKLSRIAAENLRRQQEADKVRKEQEERESEERKRQWEYERKIRESEIASALAEYPDAAQFRVEKTEYETSAKMLTITDFTPISKRRYVAFDLETTGLDSGSDAIIEIGAVLVENGVITKEYHRMVDPGKPIPAEASAVNHITDDMVVGQLKIHQVLPSFLSFIGDDILAAHNARFDMGFICQACMKNRFRIPVGFFDTMTLARYWPQAKNRKLSSLLEAADLENDDAHRAIGDARAVASLISATNKKRSESRKKQVTTNE